MSKTEIIDTIARQRLVEKICSKFKIDYRDDLSQMVYLCLLEKDDELIEQLWDNKQLNFYIASIVKTQVCSTTSTYYRLYAKTDLTLNEALEIPVPEKYTALDELCDYLNTLPTEERCLLYASVEKDKEGTQEVLETYGLTKLKLQDKLRNLRQKACIDLGGDINQHLKYWKKKKKVLLRDSNHQTFIFNSVKDAAKFVGLDLSNVRKYCSLRCYHNGYYYKYLY